MPRIAIDIVLLPPPEVMRQAIAINRQLIEQSSDGIVLDATSCLPHLSLCMGCLEGKHLTKIGSILERLAAKQAGLELTIESLATDETPSGQPIVYWNIVSNERLQKLHEEIMKAVMPLCTLDAKPSDVFPSGPLHEGTLQWINGYATKSSLSKFSPHITLGFGKLPKAKLDTVFRPASLACCHLGNYCTCRKVLASAAIR